MDLQISKSEGFKIPSIDDLYADLPRAKELNQFNILLNHQPKGEWLKQHPYLTIKKNGVEVPYVYLPIERVEWLLTALFLKWEPEIKSVQLLANSIVIVVRLKVLNPITGEWDHYEGVGAAPLQTTRGAGATEFDKILSSAVQTGAPAAKSYAIKDAAECIGKIFGKDLSRADEIGYNNLQKKFADKPLNE